MSSAHIKLGPFEMHEPIGRGGMGEVWRGIHPGQQVPVAVKIMTGKQARNPTYITAFRNEVRAVAGLDHPGVIMVFDHGEIDAEAEARSGGMFVAGSPYLAMELATQGCLRDLVYPLPWSHIKYILFSLLDALAHAHAHGVIHRDIKPANVLLTSPADHRPGLKLTDFGIAQAVDNRTDAGSTESTTGTPQYMAPEQLRGLWRDYGPWTDLYAVGCLAYQLICGDTPFQGDNFIALAHAHLKLPPPALEPDMEVPPGVEQWIRRLLAKQPHRRFKRAADAAWALMMLDNQETEAAPVTTFEVILRGGDLTPQQIKALTLPPWQRKADLGVDTNFDATIVDLAEKTNLFELDLQEEEGLLDDALPSESTSLPAWLKPPMPTNWRRPLPPAPSMRLVGAGLGLYGLRAIPLVDRLKERDALWDALLEVRQNNNARLVVLQGAAGNGKSRTVEWMCSRAHELGAVTVLKASHSPNAGTADGLAWMVARHLRCLGLGRDETLVRIGKLLKAQGVDDEYELLALTELISPAPIDGHTTNRIVRFGSPKERYALIRRLLERLGRDRPVIVWLDDIQWGQDAIAFCENVIDAQPLSPCPVLFLLTARDGVLAAQASVRRALGALLSRAGTQQLDIDPLAPADRSALVHGLLGLEGELAQQVIDRTAGNPLFAVQLVGDWVARGVLEVGSTGFVLRKGEEAVLPDDIHQVWTAHLGRLLDGMSPDAHVALEIAAVMGRAVDNNEWQQVCSLAGIKLTINLLHILFSSRLAIPEDNGWSIAHGMLRESLERLAHEHERWKSHHRACAQMLSGYPTDHQGVAERLGRHHHAAGDLELCLEPLLEGARQRRDTSDYQEAIALIELRESAMEALGLKPKDSRWGQGWVLRSWIERLHWRFDEAHKWAEKARQKAALFGWEAILPEALWGLAWIVRQQGNRQHAETLYEESLELYKRRKDNLGTAHCLKGLAILARQRQQWPQADALYQGAHSFYERCGELSGSASCLYGMGAVAHSTGHHAKAGQLLHDAMMLHRQVGDQQEVANCLNVLAENARKRGDLDSAAAGYRQALDIHEAIGSGAGIIPRLNLCIVLLDKGRYEEARATLKESRPVIEQTGQRSLLAFVHLALCLCAAGLRQWSSWKHHMPEAEKLLKETAMVDPDVARVAHAAADLAREADRTSEAHTAYQLALSQWLDLGQNDKADECLGYLEVNG